MPRYRHIHIVGAAATARYTATRARSPEFRAPDRERAGHSARLLQSIENARQQREQFPLQVGNGFYQSPGLTLTFESDPDFPLAFESLDLRRSQIQLLSVKQDEQNRTVATLLVPEDKLSILIRKLEAYRDFNPNEPQGQENRKLVTSISNIKLATLRELWTDTAELYPAANTPITWEAWLRSPLPDEVDPLDTLREAATDFGYEIISNALKFIDRTVVLIHGPREVIAKSIDVLGIIAEVRKAKTTAAFFSALSSSQQHEWNDELLKRINLPPDGSPAVGLLDTGVNHGHPLLAPVMADHDVQTLNPQWGAHDTHPEGHGTQMAGLAIYGDLGPLLEGRGGVQLSHGVQSLKLIHPADPHARELYGAVTIEGVSRLEIDTARRRVYCLAITADGRDQGRPSSWSAAIDNLSCGMINETRRLILISAGNVDLADRADYAAANESQSVQDPAQSWNAVTVGGYTEKALINEDENPGWQPLAGHGDLAPASTTSMTWPAVPKCPFKPDIVMEAGNMGRPPQGGPDFLAELQILTTNVRFAGQHRPFATFQDTSAATALAANLAARLSAQYPDFTPETLRGFLVHSARWTPAMLARATNQQGHLDTVRLLRTFGYGAPDAEALFYSANNNLTLIAEEVVQPFFEDQNDNNRVKTRDIKFHELPWPEDALLALPLNTPVELRVTLSYFVEPSPGERGWDRKYGYQSHGLRFKVIRATETPQEFRLRVNAHDRDDDYDEDHVGETGEWILGVAGPTAGSVHSNIWRGTAADLAKRRHIAVHPTLGWWRTRKGEGRFNNQTNYSLIVSVSTPSQEVDIYTPVSIQVGINVPIPV